MPIRQVLDQSAPLVKLLQRVRESRERFDLVSQSLPPALRASVRPGPVDDAGWTLLAANAAVAAKLRHLLPTLQARLAEGGWSTLVLRVKVEMPAR